MEDDGSSEELTQWFNDIRDRMDPYRRYIMIGGFIILITLVVYLGYALGGLRVCADLDGLLDSEFKCHPDFINQQRLKMDAVGQPFNILYKADSVPDIINLTNGR